MGRRQMTTLTRTVTTGLAPLRPMPPTTFALSNNGLHVSWEADIDVTWHSSLPIHTEMSLSDRTRFKFRPWQQFQEKYHTNSEVLNHKFTVRISDIFCQRTPYADWPVQETDWPQNGLHAKGRGSNQRNRKCVSTGAPRNLKSSVSARQAFRRWSNRMSPSNIRP